MVTDVSANTLPAPVLDLDAFFDSVRWGAAFTADVKIIQAPFRSGIDGEDNSSRLFAFEGPPLGLRAVRVGANEAGAGGEVHDPAEHAGAGVVGDPLAVRG